MSMKGDELARTRLTIQRMGRAALAVVLAAALSPLASCSSDGGAVPMSSSGSQASGETAAAGNPDDGTTSGPSYTIPEHPALSEYHADAATGTELGAFDLSALSQGYVGASGKSDARLKFQVIKDDMSYNYDLPNDGEPIICPLNMGDGMYSFRIMQNTSGSNYVEVAAIDQAVTLDSEFAPFLIPTVFCDYDESSAVVAKARELAAGAANSGEVVRSIYRWVVENIEYDSAKAKELVDATGYVPNPDKTLETQKGICFDYASLTGAMLRSLGIPCRVITGYVAPNDLYHAWNMVYIDGQWTSASFSIDPESWTRIDLTFAAADAGDSSTIGDATGYTDRYVY
ncbi:transglutaminase domain-containing protein [Eggerthellaceae bacterium zg-887]|nr:transglutaminase domain-containing protein [Xiamenia xianingshaonis]